MLVAHGEEAELSLSAGASPSHPPLSVSFPARVLAGQAILAFIWVVYFAIGIVLTSNGFAAGALLAGIVVIGSFGVPCAIAAVGVARRTRWGYGSAVIIHIVVGGLGGPWGIMGVIEAPGRGLVEVGYSFVELTLYGLNAIAAYALLRAPARAWFGLAPLRWSRK